MRAPRAILLGLVGLLLATFAVYAPARHNGFTFDAGRIARPLTLDGPPNRMVAELRPVAEYWSHNYWYGDGGDTSMLFRPLSVWSFAITNAAFEGVSEPELARVHHLVNIALHLLATIAACWLLVPFARGPGALLLGTAVFALHALRSEPVIDLTSRTETLAFIFGAAFLGLSRVAVFAAAARRGSARITIGLGAGVAAGITLFLGLSSKESALAWLPMAIAYTAALAWARGEPAGPQVRRFSLGVVLIGALPVAAWAWLREGALEPAGGVLNVSYLFNPIYYTDPATRLLTAVGVWAHGLFAVVAPFHLACNYGHATFALIESPLSAGFVSAAIVLLGFAAIGLLRPARRPALFVAAAFFFGFSFITTNIPLRIGTIFAERLYYTPAFALSWIVVWLWQRVGRGRWFLAVLVAAWSIACAVTIYQRNGDWRDDDTLFTHDAQVHPRCVHLQRYVARLHAQNGELDEALAILVRIEEIDPEYPNALADLGTIHGIRGDFATAEAYYRRALGAPEYRRGQARALIAANLITVLRKQGQDAEADRWVAYQAGLAAIQNGPLEGALKALREARHALPDHRRVAIDLADVLRRSERVAEAAAAYRALLGEDDLDPFVRERLAGRLHGLEAR